MNSTLAIRTIDTHAGGHPARIVIGGLPRIPGANVRDRQAYFQEHLDHLRGLLVNEPRGHMAMLVAVVVQPRSADVGLLFLSNRRYLSMCGHGTMAACTALAETGYLPSCEGVHHVKVEVPAGEVAVDYEVRSGRVGSVTLINVPSYTLGEMALPGSSGPVSLVYSGSVFALVDASRVGLDMNLCTPDQLLTVARRVRSHLDSSPLGRSVDSVLLYQEGQEIQTFASLSDDKFDRSPCGTGSSGLLAMLGARDGVQQIVTRGPSGERFHIQVQRTVSVAGPNGKPVSAIVPAVRGRAYITGMSTFLADPEDPLVGGFLPKGG